MGLGKTVQAIAIACCYSGDWPLLGNIPKWRSWHKKWFALLEFGWIGTKSWKSGFQNLQERGLAALTSMSSIPCKTSLSSVLHHQVVHSLSCRAPVSVISYDMVPKFASEITEKNFGVIIAGQPSTSNEMTLPRRVPLPQKSWCKEDPGYCSNSPSYQESNSAQRHCDS